MKFKLSEISLLSPTTKAFVSRDDRILSLLGIKHPFLSVEKSMEEKQNFSHQIRQSLVGVLKDQYLAIPNDSNIPLVLNNIANLESPNCYTVTTGQQLHLFLGPAFVLYKILAVIRMAQDLRIQFPDKNFVPIYWLASEDHDLEEIRNTNLFNHNYSWDTNQTGACGRFHVKDVQRIIDEIRNDINLDEDNIKLLNAFETIYSQSISLSEATIRLIHLLFGDTGLICINPDNPKLKKHLIPLIKKDILEQVNIQAFNGFGLEMEKAGLNLQLKGRDINFFYLKDGFRKRMVHEHGIFKVLDTDIQFTPDQLIKDIESYPERYSPNAMLRPLYQETILPNVAYIGGNSEINYWIQCSKLFQINAVNPPSLELRPSVFIIPSKTMQWLKKQEIDPLELLISRETENLIRFLNPENQGLAAQIAQFIALKKDIQNLVAQGAATELSAIVESGKLFEKTLKQVDKQLLQNQKDKLKERYTKLDEIYHMYFDINQIQERKIHSLEMLIKYKNVVFTLKNHCNLAPAEAYMISL